MPPVTPLSTAAFRLLIGGSVAESLLSARLATLDLKPKHVALLSALDLGAPGSQAELAAVLDVAPSLVVAFADHLEALGAVTRQRDTADRRRQHLVLTAEGRRLLAESLRMSREIDAELLAQTPKEDRAAVAAFLGRMAGLAGVPDEEAR